MGIRVIFLNDLRVFRNAKVADSPFSYDLDLVIVLVDEVVCVKYSMSLVVWVEGHWKTEGIVATNYFELMHDLNLECGGLPWKQVTELNRHCVIFFLALSQDGCMATGNGIFVFLLRFFLLHDLCLDDLVIDDGLELREERGLLQRKHVSALECAFQVRIQVRELNVCEGSCASEHALDVYFIEREQHFLFRLASFNASLFSVE